MLHIFTIDPVTGMTFTADDYAALAKIRKNVNDKESDKKSDLVENVTEPDQTNLNESKKD